MTTAAERILLVDDEPAVLTALRRQLRDRFDLFTAESAEAAVASIEADGPFAVIVSDLRMPGTDGIRLLGRARELAPDTVRVMLTGHADVRAAAEAVNEGCVFRFLTKPCSQDTLVRTLEACLAQHRLLTAERVLLERTLRGSVEVLSEILALVNPAAFGQAARIRDTMRHMAQALELSELWRFEIAGLLSQLGCVTLAPETLARLYAQQPLEPAEREQYLAHATLGRELLEHVPRLEAVARMIGGQFRAYRDWSGEEDADEALGASMLHIAVRLDRLLASGASLGEAIARMSGEEGEFDPRLLQTLRTLRPTEEAQVVKTLRLAELGTAMILDEDVVATNGLLLVSRGQRVTPPVLERLRNFARGIGVREPIRVVVGQPARHVEAAAGRS